MTGHEYRGINVFMLGCSGYTSPYWLTFNQANKVNAHVRKGEKGTPVVFWKFGTREAQDAGEITTQYVLRYVPSETDESRVKRTIEVKVDIPNVIVKARTYYYPFSP